MITNKSGWQKWRFKQDLLSGWVRCLNFSVGTSFFLDLGERVMIKNELIPATNPAGRATRMNLTELSMSRAGRSSTRTERACLVSIHRIACRGFQGRGHALNNRYLTLPVMSDAPSGRFWTVRLMSDAPSDRFWTMRLTSDALSDRFCTVRLTSDAPSDRFCTLRLSSDAPSDRFCTLRLSSDALRNPFSTPVLNGDAPQDRFSWHPLNTNPMLNENRILGLRNTMG